MISSKVLSAASNKVKTTVSQFISNGNDFCVVVGDLTTRNGDNITPPNFNDTQKWLSDVITKTLAYKPLPAKALENMKLKGIVPKKQPGEILVIVLIDSETHVHIGYNIPDNMKDKFIIDDYLKFLFNNKEKYSVDKNTSNIVYNADSPLKDRDTLMTKTFNYLKDAKIYIEEDDSDDELYTFDD